MEKPDKTRWRPVDDGRCSDYMDKKARKAPAHVAAKRYKKKRYSKKVRAAAITGVSVMGLIAALCIGVGGFIWHLLSKPNIVPDGGSIVDSIPPDDDDGLDGELQNFEEDYKNAQTLAQIPLRKNGNGITNYLLLGYDGNSNRGVRSDTNIILSINDRKKTIKLISLLRDTYVSLPGRDSNKDGKDDWGKLNSAYAYGGHDMQFRMIRDNFRLEITQYVGVNFKSMPIVVDAMGGLDIELTKAEMNQVPANGLKAVPNDDNWRPLTGSPGVHHLDGFQVLQYARIRHIDSDFKRTARQRHVVTLMLEKAKGMGIFQLVGVVNKALECIDTNMTQDEMLGFASNALKYKDYTIINEYYVPQDGDYVGKTYKGPGSVLEFKNQKESVEALHHYIYDE